MTPPLDSHNNLVTSNFVYQPGGPGDIVVQRGTIHRWRNPSATEACRGVMVLIEADRHRHGGVPLENVLP